MAWLSFVGVVYACILFLTPERGSGMSGIPCVIIAVYGGGLALLIAIVVPLNKQSPDASFFTRAVVGSFVGLFGVVQYGGHLYKLDQEEAKAFVDQRIAEIVRASGPAGDFPVTQDQFVGKHALPRLLRH